MGKHKMYSRICLVGCLVLFWSMTARAQDIPYEKYTLPNGMTVILHEDHSLPIACANLWYRVGSKDEKPGRSGFAHLFEHLMFMGTDRVPGGDFDNIMEAGGGWNNATTSEDRTNYFEMGPAELLPTLLWLEADRLEALGRAMTQEKLDKQRAVVRNERRQSYENAPYGKAELAIYELLYPKGHPYHHTVIGSHEDLEAATVDDVKGFFADYYVPSNALLVVAGDFDPSAIKPLIAEWFGTLPRGSDVMHSKAAAVKLDEVIRMTLTDNVQFARTSMIYHCPPRFAPGEAELDLLSDVLAAGISSRLYQKLIYESELAVDVSAYLAPSMLGSLFHVVAMVRPDRTLDEVEQAIDQVIAEVSSEGPTTEELERHKSQVEYRMLSQLQSLLAKADQMNEYEFHLGEPNSFKRDLDRYRQATPESVRSWARAVLNPDARLILRVVPETTPPEVNPRDRQPTDLGIKTFDPLLPATFQLSNGITVHHWSRHELPLLSMTVLLTEGAADEDPAKGGVTSLAINMLDEGAGGLDALAFSDALKKLGATMSDRVSLSHAQLNLNVLSGNFDAALRLFSDAILKPNFDAKEWQRVHDLHLQELVQEQDQPAIVAQHVAMRTFFGADHPYGQPVNGTTESAGLISLPDVRDRHQQLFQPSRAVILVAGDRTVEQLKASLEATFGQWPAPASPVASQARSIPPASNDALTLALVHRPDAVQTVIRFMMPASPYANPHRPQLQLLNTILGGSFTSRLNQNLREDKGYTYGARSAFVMDRRLGYFTASSSVRADVTGASIREFLKEFRGLRTGNVNEGEAKKSRATRRMETMQSFAGLNGILSAGATLVVNDRPFSELGEELNALASVGESDLNRLAYAALPLEKAVLVLVGDKDQILPQLEGLELPVSIEYDVAGRRVDNR